MTMFVTMSRYGTKLSSPLSSSISSVFSSRSRRSLLRSWPDVIATRGALSCGGSSFVRSRRPRLRRRHVGGYGALGEQVLELHRKCLELVGLLLRIAVQKDVRDHASDRDPEAHRRVVHGFGDAVRQQARAILRIGMA